MNRVKELRELNRLKQVELAAQLNISQGTLSNWERGIHDPDNESLAHLAKIFSCSIDYLLCNSDVKNPSYYNTMESENVYYKMAKDAQNAGIHPEDLALAIEFLKKAKERNDSIAH